MFLPNGLASNFRLQSCPPKWNGDYSDDDMGRGLYLHTVNVPEDNGP